MYRQCISWRDSAHDTKAHQLNYYCITTCTLSLSQWVCVINTHLICHVSSNPVILLFVPSALQLLQFHQISHLCISWFTFLIYIPDYPQLPLSSFRLHSAIPVFTRFLIHACSWFPFQTPLIPALRFQTSLWKSCVHAIPVSRSYVCLIQSPPFYLFQSLFQNFCNTRFQYIVSFYIPASLILTFLWFLILTLRCFDFPVCLGLLQL